MMRKTLISSILAAVLLAAPAIPAQDGPRQLNAGEFRACVVQAGLVYASEARMIALRDQIRALQEEMAGLSRRERSRLQEQIGALEQELAEVGGTYAENLPQLQADCGNVSVSEETYREVCGEADLRGNAMCRSFGAYHDALWDEG